MSPLFSSDKTKRIAVILLIILIPAALYVSFRAGESYGSNRPKNIVIQGVENMSSSSTTNADFSTFWQTWKLIDDNYLKAGDVNSQERVYGAIKGLVGSLGDPHSEYFPPTESKKFQEDIQGNFGGIGAELGSRQNQIVVIAPLKGSPAAKAGLRSGDLILKVNASSTEGMQIDEVVNWIRGKKGTEINLTILRENTQEPMEVKIVRDNIEVPTLDYTIENGIAHVRLYSFNSNAEQEFYNAYLDMAKQGARGMILDLRDDPGGYLEVAVDLAGWFVPKGEVVVSEAGRNGVNEQFKASGNEALKDFPVVVLINQGSASAAEILAGALRDIRGVKMIGEQSYGKGTVQQLLDLKDGSSVKLTIAHWVMPKGQVLEGTGIKPDYEVKMTEDDYKNNKDPQLDKAREVLKDLIK